MAAITRKIAHVCIFAHDLDATAAFYKDVLGIEKVFNFLRDGAVIGFYLQVGGDTHIEVFHKSTAAFADTNVINHICLEVHNLDEAIAQIRANGVAALDKKRGADGTWQSWLTDPNGVKIELFEYTPQSRQFIGGDCVVTW
jgi:lactoylglutathione lyase/glyoxylase I family protein